MCFVAVASTDVEETDEDRPLPQVASNSIIADQLEAIQNKEKVARNCSWLGCDMEFLVNEIGLTNLRFRFTYKRMAGDSEPVLAFLPSLPKKRKRSTEIPTIPAVVTNDSMDSVPVPVAVAPPASTNNGGSGTAARSVTPAPTAAEELPEEADIVGATFDYREDLYVVVSVNYETGKADIMRECEEDNHETIELTLARELVVQSVMQNE